MTLAKQVAMKCTALTAALLLLASVTSCSGDGAGIAAQGAAAIAVDPQNVTFDPTLAGGQLVREVTIESIGQHKLSILEIVFESTDDRALYFEGPPEPLPFDVKPGFARQLELFFEPYAGMEPPEGQLKIYSNDHVLAVDGSPVVVNVRTQTRTGELAITPTNLSWPPIPPSPANSGCASPPTQVKQFQIRNVGSDFLQITGYELTPSTEEPHFSVCPANFEGQNGQIPPDSERTWKVAFHPTASGEHLARLRIDYGERSREVILRGGGAGGPAIEILPQVLAWPDVSMDRCEQKNLIIANTGIGALAVRQLRLRPSHLTEIYSLSGDTYSAANSNLTEAIPEGGEATLQVTYCAEREEDFAGSLEIHHSATPAFESPLLVELLGHEAVPHISYSPDTVRISGTPEGSSSEEWHVRIGNESGGRSLNIESVSVGPHQESPGCHGQPDDSDDCPHRNFTARPDNFAPTSIPSGDFRAMRVQYSRPIGQLSTEFACLNISHDDPLSPNPLCVSLIALASPTNLPPHACIQLADGQGGGAVTPGVPVILDGICSSDPDDPDNPRAIGRYEWMLIERPPGSNASLNPSVSEADDLGNVDTTTTLIPDINGSYSVGLVVRESGAGGVFSANEDVFELLASGGN